MKLGIRICERRKKLGYTQVQLGEIVQLDASTISKIEHGERQPSIDQLERLAKALHTTERWLLHGEGPEEASEEERAGPTTEEHLRQDNARLRGQVEELKGANANLLTFMKELMQNIRGGNG
ncbi:MAG: helix-turn-helix domain-containing protein [Flavobacteriales bacterium]